MIHSKFSPASMDAELLERTFVQREPLARRLTDLFVESTLTQSKHHVLLVGPRGIGKTHLVALVHHRLSQRVELKDKLAIAFLREDEWGITSVLDLLVRILKALGADPAELTSWPPAQAEERAWETLRAQVAGKTLLLIIENLAGVLRNLGEAGQRKWRALIQNYPCWAILATTPALSADISRQASPFYGFFEIHNLEGLSASEATELVAQLAKADGDAKTAELLGTPAGRARVRVVHHLAGGNHRVFVIFYDFLREEDPDKLLEPLLKTIDSLTPYYQSQMDKLSPQQRKLVEFLCEHSGAATVKTIASGCFISHQTAAAQLKQLLEARYVQVTRLGRESYYELAEPLLRISVEVKTHDSRPLRLLVEFLRYWFSREELESRLATTPQQFLARSYLAAALAEYGRPDSGVALKSQVREVVSLLSEDLRKLNLGSAMAHAWEAAEILKRAEDWAGYAVVLAVGGRAAEAVAVAQDALQRNPEDWKLHFALSYVQLLLGQLEAARLSHDKAVCLAPETRELEVLNGLILGSRGQYADALRAFGRAAPSVAKVAGESWLSWARGLAYLGLGRAKQAVKALERAFNLDPKATPITHAYCEALFASGEYQRAATDLPREVVTHQVARRLIELSQQNYPSERLQTELLRWYRLFEATPGGAVFFGGLIGLTGFLTRLPEESFTPAARSWKEALGPPFPQNEGTELIRKLLDVALRYRESGDERVVMELPAELRKLITG